MDKSMLQYHLQSFKLSGLYFVLLSVAIIDVTSQIPYTLHCQLCNNRVGTSIYNTVVNFLL